MPPLSPAKDRLICQTLLGWDRLEKRLGGNSVIDFNLPGFVDPDNTPPRENSRYSSRYAVLEDLKALQDDPEIKTHSRLMQKLRAQEVYLRNVMGEHWDFARYIEATQGFTPRLFGEDEIASQKNRIEEILAPWNIRVTADMEKCFDDIQDTVPENKLADYYNGIFQRTAKILTPIIGTIPTFTFTVEIDDVDAYWKNWVDGGRKDYKIRFNARNVTRYAKAVMTAFALHEVVAHLVQAAIVVDKIDNGDLPHCMGMTTVHGPEQFTMEGLAITLPYFLATEESTDPLVRAFNEIYILEQMVGKNNAHIMINSGASIEDCTDYLVRHLPYKTRQQHAHTLSNKVNNPQFRSYEHVYGASAIFFRNIAEHANDEQKKTFLRRVYHDWLTADELTQFRQELLSPKTQFGAGLSPVRLVLPPLQ